MDFKSLIVHLRNKNKKSITPKKLYERSIYRSVGRLYFIFEIQFLNVGFDVVEMKVQRSMTVVYHCKHIVHVTKTYQSSSRT